VRTSQQCLRAHCSDAADIYETSLRWVWCYVSCRSVTPLSFICQITMQHIKTVKLEHSVASISHYLQNEKHWIRSVSVVFSALLCWRADYETAADTVTCILLLISLHIPYRLILWIYVSAVVSKAARGMCISHDTQSAYLLLQCAHMCAMVVDVPSVLLYPSSNKSEHIESERKQPYWST
jgi:hypothetical protein